MKKLFLLFALIFAAILINSCSDDDTSSPEPNAEPTYETPKYVIVLIGDGMGFPQVNATEAALADPDFKNMAPNALGYMNLREFPVVGTSTTFAEDRYITGSAAASTALATGYKTTINTIAMNGNHTQSYKTMAEMARDQGKKVGIVSSVSIDHATPAAFYAHTETRNNYYTIGQHLAQSGFDFFGGGGVRWNKYSGEGMDKDINLFLNTLNAEGYQYVNTRSGFDALNPGDGKVYTTLKQFKENTGDGCALPYTIDLDKFDADNSIRLSEFTEKAIEMLDNDKGFFLMVEGGKIDWACHANDFVSAALNTVEFDKAVGVALDFYNRHKDETLIVVTGDHECGGLTLGYSAAGYNTAFSLLKHQKESFQIYSEKVAGWAEQGTMTFEQAMEDVKTTFGLGDDSIVEKYMVAGKEVVMNLGLTDYEMEMLEAAFNKSMTGESAFSDEEIAVLYGYYDPFTVQITHYLNNKAGLDWTSYSHTAVPVPVYAIGQGMYKFAGYYDNTDVGKRIIEIAGYNK